MIPVTVGIDIGTTSVKAIAADGDGEVVARSRVPHRIMTPAADRLEHDPQAAWRDGVCREVRLAVAGAHPQPTRLTAIEAMLEGQPLTDERLRAAQDAASASAQPAFDFRASADYRTAMAGVMARRALETAWKHAIGH